MPGNSDDVCFAMGDGGGCVLSDERLVCGGCLAMVMDMCCVLGGVMRVCCVLSDGDEGVLCA